MSENKPEKPNQKEDKKPSGLINVPLSKPADIGGKEIETLSFDAGSLGGWDLIDTEDEREAMRPGSSSQLLYGLCLAAKAIKCPVDDLLALPAKDCNRVAAEVLNFLTD